MSDAFNGEDEVQHADHPSLRMLNLADQNNETGDSTDCPSKAPYIWAASSPSTMSARGNGSFSTKFPAAVCYYMARELLKADPTVPVGIITAAVSGSPIELWMPAEAILDGTPEEYGGNGTCGGAVTHPPHPPKSPRTTACPAGGVDKSGRCAQSVVSIV
jgi:hypothetical protein